MAISNNTPMSPTHQPSLLPPVITNTASTSTSKENKPNITTLSGNNVTQLHTHTILSKKVTDTTSNTLHTTPSTPEPSPLHTPIQQPDQKWFIQAKRTFSTSLASYIYPETTPNPPHYLMNDTIQLLQQYNAANFNTVSTKPACIAYMNKALTTCLNEEANIDQLQELLYCPITLTSLRDPVLLDSGHTCEKKAIQKWSQTQSAQRLQITNPLTNKPLEQYKRDTLTKQLLTVIRAKFFNGLPTTDQAKNTYKTLKKSAYFIDDHLQWCRLLAALMPINHFFVREKAPNHFVVEIRIPTANDNSMQGVIRTSFFINKNGLYQHSQLKETAYKTLQEMCQAITKNTISLHPLSIKTKQRIETQVNKPKILTTLLHKSSPVEKKEMLQHIINLLQLRLSASEISTLLTSHLKNTFFFRIGISPTSFPSFTMIHQNNEHVNEKRKVGFHNGKFYVLHSYPIKKEKNTFFIQINETFISLNSLPKNHPLYEEIMDEFAALFDAIKQNEITELHCFKKIKSCQIDPYTLFGRIYTSQQTDRNSYGYVTV